MLILGEGSALQGASGLEVVFEGSQEIYLHFYLDQHSEKRAEGETQLSGGATR